MDYTEQTNGQLTEAYNTKAGDYNLRRAETDEEFPLLKGPWKGKKDALIERLMKLDRAIANLFEVDIPEAAPVAETPKPAEATPSPAEAAGEDDASDDAAPDNDSEVASSGRTIRETSLHWLCAVDYFEDKNKKSGDDNRVSATHKDARSVGFEYRRIIEEVQKEHPGANTSVACLRWYSVKVRVGEFGYENYKLAQRRPRAKPQR